MYRLYSKCILIFRHLDVRLGRSCAYQKTNTETVVEIQESVRGKDVYIIQTGSKYVDFVKFQKELLIKKAPNVFRILLLTFGRDG